MMKMKRALAIAFPEELYGRVTVVEDWDECDDHSTCHNDGVNGGIKTVFDSFIQFEFVDLKLKVRTCTDAFCVATFRAFVAIFVVFLLLSFSAFVAIFYTQPLHILLLAKANIASSVSS